MSLWSDYVTELVGSAVTFIEHPWGFISYSLPTQFPDSVLAEDIYIRPQHRNGSNAYQLLGDVERAGRQAGRTHVIFVVKLAHANAGWNLDLYLGLGFIPFSANNDIILLKRPFSPVKE